MARQSFSLIELYGYDLFLGSIAAFYVFMVPYTKVEESFNIQAMHDILYHRHHIENYDHLEFPGVVPRTFIGSLLVSILASPIVSVMSLLQLPKIYSLYAVRLALGCIILFTLRFFRVQIRDKFGHQVEAFFVIFVAFQFHMLFYCTRPLPNILALGLVNLAYGYWLNGSFYAALNLLIFATIVFRCDILLFLCPLGLELLLTKSISFWKALKYCIGAALFSIGLTMLVDTIMWRRPLWPEFEVFWFNSVLNRSSEWGTQSFHWYFTSALPRSLLAAYPLFVLGTLLDRRLLFYVLPVFSFVLIYSKLPHKVIHMDRLSMIKFLPITWLTYLSHNYKCNRSSVSLLVPFQSLTYPQQLQLVEFTTIRRRVFGSCFILLCWDYSLSGCTIVTFMASYENYPGAHGLKDLHRLAPVRNNTDEVWVHIDPFSAMNGISRFCENDFPWRYSKEEEIHLEEFSQRNFTYLLNEHPNINGFKCLFAVNGFSRLRLQIGFPPVLLVKEPKVFIHGNIIKKETTQTSWPGCS